MEPPDVPGVVADEAKILDSEDDRDLPGFLRLLDVLNRTSNREFVWVPRGGVLPILELSGERGDRVRVEVVGDGSCVF